MNIQSVIDRAMKDEKFAAELRDQAIAAAEDADKGEAWEKFMSNFAESPEELARLNMAVRLPLKVSASDRALMEKELGTTTTLTTITTTATTTATTTLPCTLTTTTTTTGTLTTLTTHVEEA